jgi:hypothetical protein
LGWDIPGVATDFTLQELDEQGVVDVLRQMGNPLAPLADRFNVAETLFHKSQGDPLVVGLYVSELKK